MDKVTIRDLRNQGGRVVDRVLAGESLVVTRSGKPVAELRPVRRKGLSARQLMIRWRALPPIDPEAMKREIDDLTDASL